MHFKRDGTIKFTADLQLVKQTNKRLLFNLIYKSETISRAELAKITKLSPTTVSSLVNELIEDGYVIEMGIGDSSTSGRKPILLKINPDRGYVLSFEFKQSEVCFSIYNLICECKTENYIKYENLANIHLFQDVIKDLINKSHINSKYIMGISIAVPGLIDFDSKTILSSTIIDIDVVNALIQQITYLFPAIETIIENESNLYAYAEYSFGDFKNVKNMVFIDVNSGIGSGIIIEGNIYKGSEYMAAELGHMSIDSKGPKCKCGNYGCFEIMAGINAIIQKILFGIMSGRDTIIKKYTSNDLNKVTIDLIIEAFENGDLFAEEVIEEVSNNFACAINNINNILNPQVIILGGEITKFGEKFICKILDKFNKISLKDYSNSKKVYFSSIKRTNAVTLGGARYLLDRLFKNESADKIIFNE